MTPRPMAPEHTRHIRQASPILKLSGGVARAWDAGMVSNVTLPPVKPVTPLVLMGDDEDDWRDTLDERTCPDCGETYRPKATNQVRCTACAVTKKNGRTPEAKAQRRERLDAQKVAKLCACGRIFSPVRASDTDCPKCRGHITREINKATRERGKQYAANRDRQLAHRVAAFQRANGGNAA